MASLRTRLRDWDWKFNNVFRRNGSGHIHACDLSWPSARGAVNLSSNLWVAPSRMQSRSFLIATWNKLPTWLYYWDRQKKFGRKEACTDNCLVCNGYVNAYLYHEFCVMFISSHMWMYVECKWYHVSRVLSHVQKFTHVYVLTYMNDGVCDCSLSTLWM